jgi:hypothetical protein
LGGGLRGGLSWRSATGRPFTPIIAATYDPGRDVYIPIAGAPFSERFPSLERVDVSLSRLGMLTPSVQSVVYISLANITNRENVQEWRYDPDYSVRTPVGSIFNRSFYIGASLTWR